MVVSNKLIIVILMLISYYDIRTASAEDQEPNPSFLAQKFCSRSNYSANSTYKTNLNLLLSSLSDTFRNNNTIPLNGYRNVTIGENPDTVYGSLHCREDIAPDICSDCVQLATDEVVKDSMCPNSKGAIMFYSACILRYSDRSYFSLLSENPSLHWISAHYILDPKPRMELVTGLLDDLVIKAVINSVNRPSLFATGATNYTNFSDIYGMVQCTPDLTPTLCNRCLRLAIGKLPGCCNDTQGARVLLPSCTVRYEIYTFYGQYKYTTRASPPILQSASDTAKRNGNHSLKLAVSVAVPLGIAVLLSYTAVWYWFYARKGKMLNHKDYAQDVDQDISSAESLQFNFDAINIATDHFSEANKLGQGGFGTVYKGTLSDGQEIAVKRLSKSSGQGDQEFKNEVLLLAKLQHRNLVRLLGFCLHGQEKLLVYELMNSSLDHFIFDNMKRTCLDWECRYKIIGGIARGLLYLHEDSRVRIIHRDLKTSNILLAPDMLPKISDFGMARLFVVDQTQDNTNKVVGTYGYMAPEYALHGHFSAKSDVFSFGVLILEILSGKKNISCYESVIEGVEILAE
ncbi:cysteine-rich receptor-like protein kinase 10 isoform X2 [Papaver somniferum]|uniref:cysteine-rich receptor-like protein kinase 10 isoform X2 n=1 Tax=Papaver somniferum TaxID=3469 RepID=UPI000E6F8882|nr:cysteine-rich receptor-like protein kinase 10 isoform X2 [Papaver somniferum]